MSAFRRVVRLCTVCDEPGRRLGSVVLCSTHEAAAVQIACPRCSSTWCKHCDDTGSVPATCAVCDSVVLLDGAREHCKCTQALAEWRDAPGRELDALDTGDGVSLEQLVDVTRRHNRILELV